jgi:hypothetical protein
VSDARAATSVSLGGVEGVREPVAAASADVHDSERRRCLCRNGYSQAGHCQKFRYALPNISESQISESRQMFAQLSLQLPVVRLSQC